MNKIKKAILSNKFTRKVVITVRHYQLSFRLYRKTLQELNTERRKEHLIFYLGIPAHGNLGDLAQGVCIRRWLKKTMLTEELLK